MGLISLIQFYHYPVFLPKITQQGSGTVHANTNHLTIIDIIVKSFLASFFYENCTFPEANP